MSAEPDTPPQAAPNGAQDARDPSGFLSEIIGAPVTVKLNSGVVYRGTLQDQGWCVCVRSMADNCAGELQSVDGYMNIALEDTKEYVDGKLRRNYGDAFVRGNNGESKLRRTNFDSGRAFGSSLRRDWHAMRSL